MTCKALTFFCDQHRFATRTVTTIQLVPFISGQTVSSLDRKRNLLDFHGLSDFLRSTRDDSFFRISFFVPGVLA